MRLRIAFGALVLFSSALAQPDPAASPAKARHVTARERLTIFANDTFGPAAIATSTFWSGVYQWADEPPEWGQGMAGFGRRFGSRFGIRFANSGIEQSIGALIGEDPRYYRYGPRRCFWERVAHAITSSFIAGAESRGAGFAYGRVSGMLAGAAVSNAWFPDRQRTFPRTLESAGVSLAATIAGNGFSEFWPDVWSRLRRRKR